MPYIVGLTGGIGSGKSTVAQMLADRGAIVLDADAIVRELQQPGTDVFTEIVATFGEDILAPDGTIDRPKLGEIVFASPERRRLLEAIIWPRVGETVARRLEEIGESDDIVVLDVPLMAESSESRGYANAVIVVDASKDTQYRHLEGKGVSRKDAAARMGAQVSREDRLRFADFVVTNDGSLDELEKQVEELWRTLQERARA